jgi:hypothetical protein
VLRPALLPRGERDRGDPARGKGWSGELHRAARASLDTSNLKHSRPGAGRGSVPPVPPVPPSVLAVDSVVSTIDRWHG